MTELFYGTFIHTPKLGELQVWLNTGLGIDKATGEIRFIHVDKPIDEILQLESSIDPARVKDISKNPYQFFFPGFVDTHIHAPQYPNNGIFGNSTLLDWLTTYTFPLESSLKDLDRARLVYDKVIKRTLSNGTTCAAYYATIDPDATNLLADLALEYNQRAFIGKVCMNDNSPDFYIETLKESQDSTVKVLDHIKQIDPAFEIVSPILTPRFAPSCTSELLQWLGNLKMEQHLHCQTHISENKNEIEWVKKLFPKSKTYTHVYDDHNLLDDKTILAHAIHLSDEEMELIKLRKSGIAHCPISNSSITSGEARVRWLLDNGINVGLGTDVSGGFSPSILCTARQALLVSRHLAMGEDSNKNHLKLSVEEVFYLATMGGAKVVGLQDKIGTFAVGKKLDAQLVDLNSAGSQVDVFDWQLPQTSDSAEEFQTKYSNIMGKWLCNGDDRNTVGVWVNGKQVKQAGGVW